MFGKLKHILIFLTVMGLNGPIFSQNVSGTVVDAATKQPIAFANVWIAGTQQGTTTNLKGEFQIQDVKNDTVMVSFLGYHLKRVSFSAKQNSSLVILLEEDVKLLLEVTIRPEIERAKELFGKIQEHRKENRRRIQNVDEYKTLENTSVYAAIDTSSNIRRYIDDFDEVTIEGDQEGLRFAPIYLREEAKSYRRDSVELKYAKKEGIFPTLNMAIETYILQNIAVDVDFYKDVIYILERGFTSPLSGSALSQYSIYLDDSTMVDGVKRFQFTYVPKNKFDPLFSGHFEIEDSTFALTEITAHIAKDANINFVNGFKSKVVYRERPDGGLFYDRQMVGLNISLIQRRDSTDRYSARRLENVSAGNWLVNKSIQYSLSPELDEIRPQLWKNQPEFSQESLEDEAYIKVARIKDNDLVKGVDAVGGLVLTGFLNVGKIDIGPMFDVYSRNAIEGQRFSIPLRTSEKFNDRFSVGGFLGYGTTSKEFKYGANLDLQPFESDKLLFRFAYHNDYTLISNDRFYRLIKQNPNNKGTGNVIAVLTTREKNPYLKLEESYEMRVEYRADSDIILEFTPYFVSSSATGEVKFVRQDVDFPSYDNYGAAFTVRLPFGQHYDRFFFDRVYYINPTPLVNLSGEIGQTLLPGQSPGGGGYYGRLRFSIQGRLILGQVFMNYMTELGYLVGDASYTLLDQPVGSMSLGYAKYEYNLLHHASFAHNATSNTHVHFNGGGILMNSVPLLRRLKLREILSFKVHIGKLTHDYNGVFDLPEFFHNEFTEPYAEVGFGFTNILKVLRIEYVHQLNQTYIDRSFTDNGGIRIRAEMSF